MSDQERRFFETTVELRAEEGSSVTLTGYAVKWASLSQDLGGFREQFQRGSFAEALAGNPDIVGLFNHDRSLLLGRSPATLRVAEDDTGLRYEIDLADTSIGRDVRLHVERGDLRGASFAFRVPAGGDEWTNPPDGLPIRTVRRASLHDVSPATHPAYLTSEVTLRSLEEATRSEEDEKKSEAEADERRRALALAEADE